MRFRTRFSLHCIIGTLGFGWAGCASLPAPEGWQVGEVEGTLSVSAGAAAAAGPFVVYLDSSSETVPTRSSHVARVGHDGAGFAPALVALGKGERLEIENRSDLYHQLFWIASGGQRELALAPSPSAPKRIRITEPGVLRFYCALHPDEHFSVFVAPNPHFTAVQSKEKFIFRAVPIGSWQLRVWSETLEGPVTDLEVRAGESQVRNIRIEAKGIVRQ